MFAYQLTQAGLEHLQRVERERREPLPSEVEIAVEASSINYHDIAVLSGLIPTVRYPLVPMSDGCGSVARLGSRVFEVAEGDRVIPLFFPFWISGRPSAIKKRRVLGDTNDGCLQEFFTIEADSVVTAPAHLSAEEAATLPCAGLTAWQALMDGNLEPGSTVLIQGTGGVAIFALQFAKAMGFRAIVTSSSDLKLEKAKKLGADHLINYRTTPDWHRAVHELTDGVGVDGVIEVGGEHTLHQSVKAARMDGYIAVIGVLSGFGDAHLSVSELMQKNITLKGITVGNKESFMLMCRFMELHNIRPEISHRFRAEELAKGVELMLDGGHFGKVAVEVV